MIRATLLALFVALIVACSSDLPAGSDAGAGTDTPAGDASTGDALPQLDVVGPATGQDAMPPDGQVDGPSTTPDAGPQITNAANRRSCVQDSECDDRIACTEDTCVRVDMELPRRDRCQHRPIANLCPMGQSCDPRMGCRAGRVCATDADCTDRDECTLGERCDNATRFCIYDRVYDGDDDGYASVSCGGRDCNDGDRNQSPVADELCNGRDDNCNGVIDDSTAPTLCSPGGSCVMGSCRCSGGLTYCDGAGCVNAQTDALHCGGCGSRCQEGASCMAGRCVTPCAMLRCGDACVDPQTNPTNCGGCGRACASGQTCVAGTCRCPSGQSACSSGCADLMTDGRNCGECGVRCFTPDVRCEAGTCRATRCPTAEVMCGTVSVCTFYDPRNCGSCGTRCSVGQVCIRGVCGV
ncbi:MAG: hypothetical protein HY903_22010 [Deltaproteobacteria bacterium]|nr:hypothetical protein [Deltaproteobacteria bacterium]